jgi:Cof subfamily protein (haloacid dehalogenase superfamily)
LFSNCFRTCIIKLMNFVGEKMAYKLVAIDLDDTLLTNEGVIIPRVKRAIRKAAEKGVYVVLSTGRTKRGAQKYYDELMLDTLLISSGGAEVHNTGGAVVFTRPVDPALTRELLAWAYKNEIHAQVYIDGEFVYRKKNKFTEYYEILNGYPGTLMPNILAREIVTPKVLYAVDENKITDVSMQVRKRFPMLSIKRSNLMYLDFSHPDVSKGTALAFVADYYHVDSKETIAIGDTEIDIPMIEYAGLGVAVANANAEVKKAADIVCASNQEGGVADVIQKFILEAEYEDQTDN